MKEKTLSTFEIGGVLTSITLIMGLMATYVYFCFAFDSAEAKPLAYIAGSVITLILAHHLGRIYAIFKYKQMKARAEYLLNYPMLLTVTGYLFALLFLGIQGLTPEAKTALIGSLVLLGSFNLFLTIRLSRYT